MARSYLVDPLLACNFALIDVPAVGLAPLAFPFKLAKTALANGSFVGMQSISVPEMSAETRQIKEGTADFVHTVYTGFTTGGTATLTQAVLASSLDMYLWFLQGIRGRFVPRRHFIVAHLRQDKSLPRRLVFLQNCIPISWKPASDFDATAAQVSLESITMQVTHITPIPTQFDDLSKA